MAAVIEHRVNGVDVSPLMPHSRGLCRRQARPSSFSRRRSVVPVVSRRRAAVYATGHMMTVTVMTPWFPVEWLARLWQFRR